MSKNNYTAKENVTALIAAVQSSNALIIDETDVLISQNFILTNIASNIADMTEGLLALKDFMMGEHMKGLEEAAENRRLMERIADGIENAGKDKGPAPKEQGGGSWWGLLAAAAAGLVAGFEAFAAGVINDLKAIGRFFKLDKALIWIEEALAPLKNGFANMKAKALSWVDDIARYFDDVFKAFKESAVGRFLDNILARIKAVFKFDGLVDDFVKLGDSIKGMFKLIFDPIRNLFGGGGGGLIDNILKVLNPALDLFKPITSFFTSIGSILGKLAVPLQIIMSVWDTMSGAIDGWNNTQGTLVDKIFGAIEGGLTGLLNGLIGSLLDLLKSGVAWIAEFFGAKGFADWLNGFSFEEIIGNFVTKVVDFVKGIFTWFGDLFTDPGAALAQLASKIGDMANMGLEMIKEILRAVLPRKNPSGSWYDPANLASKAIPDAVYEFAGIDPGTGQDLVQEQTANTQLNAEAAANNGGNRSQAPVIINNNNGGGGGGTQVAPLSSRSTPTPTQEDFDARNMQIDGA